MVRSYAGSRKQEWGRVLGLRIWTVQNPTDKRFVGGRWTVGTHRIVLSAQFASIRRYSSPLPLPGRVLFDAGIVGAGGAPVLPEAHR